MSLDELRNRIDEIDNQLVELLNERARVVVQIGEQKSRTGGQIYAPDREKRVLESIVKSNKGLFGGS
jgi:chorismate mutase